jgi:regulator of sirC expression with transglutaminase-like and TPR domain
VEPSLSKIDPIRHFKSLAECPDELINLAEAALAIAATEYYDLDPEPWLESLDRLAARVQAGPELSALANIAAINKVLFEEENFSGNSEEYDDPRNSYLNDVLERKKGIPITLSVIYAEVAWRKGLPLVGVGFPGHFLVKHPGPPADIVIDPYHRGTILAPADCSTLLRENFGSEAELKPEYFAAATKKQILSRMLNNLKGSYYRRNNYPKVLTMIELALATSEDVLSNLRDRGMVYFAMRRYSDAVTELNTYLKLAGKDDPEVQEVLHMLGRIKGMMN